MRTFLTTIGTLAMIILGVATTAAAAPTAWIVTTEFGTYGRVRSLDCADPWPVSGDLATIPGDAVGRHKDGKIFIVGRGSWDLIQIWDPADGFSLVREFSLGTGLNPQDIAFDSQGEAYISCYDAAVLLRVDPATGTVLGSYDTSAFADADGLPETSWMATVGDRLYITCQLLDRNDWYAPTGPGHLLVFDMATESWVDADPGTPGVQPVTLQGANPYTRILVGDGVLSVGCAGYFGLADGGVENIDLATHTSLGYEVTESELGGDVNRIRRDGADLIAVVNDASFNTSIRRTGTEGVQVLETLPGFYHGDIWLLGGDLYVADRTVGAAGLRVLDPLTGTERTDGAIPTGLAPFAFIPMENPPVADVPSFVTSSRVALGAPYPNPCNPTAFLPLTGMPGAEVHLDVVDLRGRRVRSDGLRLDGGGHAVYRFSGRDQRGRSLAAGVYGIIATIDGDSARRRVVLVK